MRVIKSPIPAATGWLRYATPAPVQVEPGFQTVRQIAAEMGRSESHGSKIVRDLCRTGAAERKVFRPPGCRLPVPHYRLTNQNHEKTKPRQNQKHRCHR